MIIGIDIDDTISETCEVMFNYAQQFVLEELKRDITISKEPCYTHMYIQHMLGLNDEESDMLLDKYYETIVKNVRPKTLSVEYLNRLHEEGNKIVLITARWDSPKFDIRELTKKWLNENNIPFDELVINAENKLIACKENNVNVFIDDSYKNCKMVSEEGIKTFIMDSRSNRDLELENVKRVFSWPQIYNEIYK